ncbi:hypothetical protein H0H93_008765 [Arthromyces matolae]|nr:hypothetical protein H0H93_008765 [Arthromyces matolae]
MVVDERYIEDIVFSTDGDRVVVLQGHDDDESCVTVIMYDICDGSLSLVASSTIAMVGPQAESASLRLRLKINPVNSSQFLLIIFNDLEQNPLTDAYFRVIYFELLANSQLVSKEIDLHHDEKGLRYHSHECYLQFSPCGQYLVWGGLEWEQLQGRYSFVHPLIQGSSSQECVHPMLMETTLPYIHGQSFLQFYSGTDYFFLHQRGLLGDSAISPRERVLGLQPKSANGGLKSFLIWPEDDEAEVIIVMVGDGDSFVIETGILSGDVLTADAWIDVEVLR